MRWFSVSAIHTLPAASPEMPCGKRKVDVVPPALSLVPTPAPPVPAHRPTQSAVASDVVLTARTQLLLLSTT